MHQPPCIISLGGLIHAGVLCASVVTTVNPDLSTAQATVASASVSLVGLPVISLTAVQASSATTCAASGGSATIAFLKVGTLTLISSKMQPKPNTTLTVGPITIVLNAHIPVAGASRGTTVNAVEIIIPGVETIVLGSATSDIHNC